MCFSVLTRLMIYGVMIKSCHNHHVSAPPFGHCAPLKYSLCSWQKKECTLSSFSSSPTAQFKISFENQANIFMQLNNCVPKFPGLAWRLLQNAGPPDPDGQVSPFQF